MTISNEGYFFALTIREANFRTNGMGSTRETFCTRANKVQGVFKDTEIKLAKGREKDGTRVRISKVQTLLVDRIALHQLMVLI